MAIMSSKKAQVKHEGSQDETRPFAAKGHVDVHKLDRGMVMKGVFEPGWKWSEHVKPIAGTNSCQASHCGYVLSGRMKIVMDDGSSIDVGPGDFFEVAPGHDAWTIGTDPCVMVDWGGYEGYAKPATAGANVPRPAQQPRKPQS
jgi:hypothetical protein